MTSSRRAGKIAAVARTQRTKYALATRWPSWSCVPPATSRGGKNAIVRGAASDEDDPAATHVPTQRDDQNHDDVGDRAQPDVGEGAEEHEEPETRTERRHDPAQVRRYGRRFLQPLEIAPSDVEQQQV